MIKRLHSAALYELAANTLHVKCELRYTTYVNYWYTFMPDTRTRVIPVDKFILEK